MPAKEAGNKEWKKTLVLLKRFKSKQMFCYRGLLGIFVLFLGFFSKSKMRLAFEDLELFWNVQLHPR